MNGNAQKPSSAKSKRRCHECGRDLPKGKKSIARFCSPRCTQKNWYRRHPEKFRAYARKTYMKHRIAIISRPKSVAGWIERTIDFIDYVGRRRRDYE